MSGLPPPQWHFDCTLRVQRKPAGRTPGRQDETKAPRPPVGREETTMAKLSKITRKIDKTKVKSFLNQRVRLGFLSVPLWMAGAYLVARRLRARRHYA